MSGWVVWAACASEGIHPREGGSAGGGWVVAAAEPAAFQALVDADRGAWSALHAHQPEQAYAQFPEGSVGRTRAAVAVATLHDDAAALSARVHGALWSRWRERAAAGAAAAPPADAPWLEARADQCRSLPDGAPPEAVARHDAVTEALARGDADAVGALAVAPLRVSVEGGVERRLFDPCGPAALRAVWGRRATGGDGGWASLALPADELASSFLAAWPTGRALADELAAGGSPATAGPRAAEVTALGVDGPGTTADDARDRVAALEAGVGAVAARLLDQADPAGAAVVAELALAERWREQLSLALAREALGAGHPEAAAVWLRSVERPAHELAVDPSVGVLLALAELDAGHTREALGALHPAAERRPTLHPTEDALADLTVLEGLGRSGDSKEDP